MNASEIEANERYGQSQPKAPQLPGFYSITYHDEPPYFLAIYRKYPSFNGDLGMGPSDSIIRFQSAEGRHYYFMMESARWLQGCAERRLFQLSTVKGAGRHYRALLRAARDEKKKTK